MLRAIKDTSALIFAPLKVPDATIFASPACKRDEAEMKRLSIYKGEYHHLAPIVFADPNQMTPNGFLRSVVLLNVLCLLLFGRNAFTKEKACGGPKERGQIHSIHSMTEGLIALAVIFVFYLLSPDPELQIVGSETKIPYEADYDFYLEHLFKRSKWAIDTVSWFNMELFGSKQQTSVATEPRAPPATTCTWEDDFLNSLDNMTEPAAPVSIGSVSHTFTALEDPVHSLPPSPIHPSPSPSLGCLSPLSSPPLADPQQITTSNAMKHVTRTHTKAKK
ncbi:hypothetical protein PAXRUDRAFT_17322 [Paxillus rubicundulus Ve08.2h10]|uniref:Uncharacterized protein n=1 Tax=Paxillus rubicundulus Ve08.2h10 TaxID=930991 RepID=A0A0D0D2C7_9AGAM|nr:hypothetical protein PAXRUDRAFT_17322 [Paxillus rubicundulus Ve08.2h10]